jgi:truncated hemoglobin YjbI
MDPLTTIVIPKSHSHVPFFLIMVLLFVVILWLSHHLRKALHFQKRHQDLVRQYENYEYADSTTNLFIKYGGLDTVRSIVDSSAAALSEDPLLAPVFGVLDTTGHRSEDELKACLDLQFTSLLGGPLPYPGRTITRGVAVHARSMLDSHKHLTISKEQFSRFVTILAGVLTNAGVTSEDLAGLATGLNAMASSIITVQ